MGSKNNKDNNNFKSNHPQRIDRNAQIQKLESLGQFAGGIAHDFNNILSIIEGYTHMSLKRLKEGTLTEEYLEKILKSTQRGAGLTRQLLSFGRLKIDVEEKINLAEEIKGQHVLLHPLLGESIKLFMTTPEEAIWISASSDQLTQVVLNLAINARDAMPDGGELAIIFMPCQKRHIPVQLKKHFPKTDFIRLSIVDSGEGMPREVLEKIFDPFFTTKDQGQGTGLGLSVVYGIIDQLNGSIEVSSVPNDGTSFDIYLPITSPPEGTLDIPSPCISKVPVGVSEPIMKTLPLSTDNLSGKTILVAEDEAELREILVQMFKDLGMEVLDANNGNNALVVQDDYEGDIDFLLTDVVMPEMDGVKLGEMFKSVRPEANIVYMSGYPFMDGRKDIKVPKEAPFISKPIQEDKVKNVLERALQRRRERLGEDN